MGASILQFAGALIITIRSDSSAVQFNKIAVEPTAIASRFARYFQRWLESFAATFETTCIWSPASLFRGWLLRFPRKRSYLGLSRTLNRCRANEG